MTDELRELERRLERATAPRSQNAGELDAETASLRAGWLALDELLEAVQPPAEPPMGAVPFVPVQRRKRWMLARATVLAASLLIAVCVISSVQRSVPKKHNPSVQDLVVIQPEQSPDAAKRDAKATESATDGPATASTQDRFAWNDSFDEDMASMSLAVRRAQQDQYAFASMSDRVQYRLESLQSEIDDGSL